MVLRLVHCAWLAQLLALSLIDSASTRAADPAPPAEAKPDAKAKDDKATERLVESRHTVTINGTNLAYTARAGTIILRDAEEKLAAVRHDLTLARAENVRLHSEVFPWACSFFVLSMGLLCGSNG